VFPSTLAYLCYNRGVQLIGANRAAPFFHTIPVFGSVMAIFFLGERLGTGRVGAHRVRARRGPMTGSGVTRRLGDS
jgi:hypothetical protein